MIKHKLIINAEKVIDSSSITSFYLTESVNEGQDLTIGSTCSAMIEFSVRKDSAEYIPQYGDRIELQESDGGKFTKHGTFYVEFTKQVTDKVYKVTAYDSVSKLDKDITKWLQTVKFPISLYDLTKRAIQQCGATLANAEIPNGNYQVKAFQASGITARNICRWAGEISARFCHATDDGEISFDWYTPAGIDIAYSKHECDIEHFYHGTELEIVGKCIKADYVSGNLSMDSNLFTQSYADGTLTANYTDSAERLMYYMNSFKREAFQTAPIEKVQIQSTPDDIGTIYPNVSGEKNTYKITGNHLLTADSGTELNPIAEYIYKQLKSVTYTPANVAYPSDFRVKVGNTVKIITADGKSYTTYVMKRTESGSKDSISCSGNKTRQSTTAVNNQSFRTMSGKITEIKADVEGVSVRVEEVNQSAADNLKNFSDSVTAEIDGIKNQLDGVIDTWYGEEIPTEKNKPAVDWVTPQDKEKHSGDLYYVVGSGPNSGESYRWISMNGRWYWDKLANSDIAKALEAAAKAQDTADGKRRVFVDTPYTPYDKGDLWSQGSSGELMRCNVSRKSGAYVKSDWGVATDSGARLDEQKKDITDLSIRSDGIVASVSSLSNSVDSRFSQTAKEISAKVSHDGGDASSFAYSLTANGFYLKANNKLILAASVNGLGVNGKVTATSGAIGGMNIAEGALTTNNATYENGKGGIYLGPKGLNVQEKFYVNANTGKLTAKEAEIHGDIYAENGYFHGTVRAGKIEYSGSAGYFSGSGLSGMSVSGGKLSSTVSDNIAKGVKASDITSGRVSAISMASNDFTTSTLHIGTHLVLRIPAKLRNPSTGQLDDYMVLATYGKS